MTRGEITRLRVINHTIDGILTIRDAADLLNLSERQVIRLKGGVIKEGPAFIIHKNRGRKPSHAITNEMKQTIIKLKQSEEYREANFSHFRELLEIHEGFSLSYPSIHRILTQAGIVSPKKHRKKKVHHRRKRKPQEGMLVQIDASPHPWFFGEESFSLHGAIDDATGKVLALHFTKNECLRGYFRLMYQVIDAHGIPLCLYCDRHTIFVSPKEDKLSLEEQLEGKRVNLTQFGRAMDELGVSIVKAYSPQAKGRIERLWGTLQSRLPVEFKIHNINNMDAANAFLPKFIDYYNKQFAVSPEDPNSSFRAPSPGLDLGAVLCIKKQRVLDNANTFSYGGRCFRLRDTDKVSISPRAKITVMDGLQGDIRVFYDGKVYETETLKKRPKAKDAKRDNKVAAKGKKVIPAPDHPWRLSEKNRPRYDHEESDRELLERLYNSTQAWA